MVGAEVAPIPLQANVIGQSHLVFTRLYLHAQPGLLKAHLPFAGNHVNTAIHALSDLQCNSGVGNDNRSMSSPSRSFNPVQNSPGLTSGGQRYIGGLASNQRAACS